MHVCVSAARMQYSQTKTMYCTVIGYQAFFLATFRPAITYLIVMRIRFHYASRIMFLRIEALSEYTSSSFDFNEINPRVVSQSFFNFH